MWAIIQDGANTNVLYLADLEESSCIDATGNTNL